MQFSLFYYCVITTQCLLLLILQKPLCSFFQPQPLFFAMHLIFCSSPQGIGLQSQHWLLPLLPKSDFIYFFPETPEIFNIIRKKYCLLEGIKMDEWDLMAAIWSITLLYERNLSINQRFITPSIAVAFTLLMQLDFTSSPRVSADQQEVKSTHYFILKKCTRFCRISFGEF